MREIKFRSWSGTKFYYWGIINDNFVSPIYSDDKLVKEISQFTGLTDKLGKEIYEGDIVKCKEDMTEEFTGYIWYRCPDFVIRQDLGNDNFTYVDCFRDKYIIGNIYENPELITN